MSIPSKHTKFSSEDISFMDKQISERMEEWEIDQEVKKEAGKKYQVRLTKWKQWDDAEFTRKVKEWVIELEDHNQSHKFHHYTPQSAYTWFWSICKYALERKALTKKQKLFALDVSKRMGKGLGDAFRGIRIVSYKKWADKWKQEIEQFKKLYNFRDIEVGNSDTFKVEGIIIHNSVGATAKVIEKVKNEITKAFRLIRGGNFPEMKKVLYGHAHLVNAVGGDNVLGFYNHDEDNVYIRLYQTGNKGMQDDDKGYIHVLIHELAHRCYKKFMTPEFKGLWRQYYDKLRFRKVQFSFPPEKGEPMHFKVKGFGSVNFHSYKKGDIYVSSEDGNKVGNMGSFRRVRDIYENSLKSQNFPTEYSMTNSEEFFCEVVGMYLRGKLLPIWLDDVKGLFGIKKETAEPPITKVDINNEEKSEESEKQDVLDRMVTQIEDTIKEGAFSNNRQWYHFMALLNRFSLSLFKKEFKDLGNSGFSSLVKRAIDLGVDQGKFEFDEDKNHVYIAIPQIDEEDEDNSEVEIAIANRYEIMKRQLFHKAKDLTGSANGVPAFTVKTRIIELIAYVSQLLEKDGIVADISVISDILKKKLEEDNGKKTPSGLVYQEGTNWYFQNKVEKEIEKEETDGEDEGSGEEPSPPPPPKDPPPPKEPQPPKDPLGTEPQESTELPELTEVQKEIMLEVCALLQGDNGDVTARDVWKSITATNPDYPNSLRSVGRYMGQLVRVDLLTTVGKTPVGTIYKFGRLGEEWCKVEGTEVEPKDPPKPPKEEKEPSEKSVEHALVEELRKFYQLVEPKGNKEFTNFVVALGRHVKTEKLDQIPTELKGLNLRMLLHIVQEFRLDLEGLPLIKTQIDSLKSKDREEVTPLVQELRRMYADMRKAWVTKKQLALLIKIAVQCKEEELNEVPSEHIPYLEELIKEGLKNKEDYPITFKDLEQGTVEEDEEEDFHPVTEIGKIILRVMGLNLDKEESASSIRNKVNRFPNTNVTTKGLGRTMGALVRYGYLKKTGTSPSGTTYQGTDVLGRWYDANSSSDKITGLGQEILKLMGVEPRQLYNTVTMHSALSSHGMTEMSKIGVGRSLGKLARDGWLEHDADKKYYKLAGKGLEWYHNFLAK